MLSLSFGFNLKKNILVGSAMQQPYLMGEEAVKSLNDYFNNKAVKKNKDFQF